MTPTNPLDDKVIIRKSHFAEICAMLNPLNQEQDRVANKAMRLLAQNNTGWAAVPVKPTKEQLDKAICPMPDYRPDDDDFDDLEYEMASHDRHEGKMYWECLLAASPPLPGGGE